MSHLCCPVCRKTTCRVAGELTDLFATMPPVNGNPYTKQLHNTINAYWPDWMRDCLYLLAGWRGWNEGWRAAKVMLQALDFQGGEQ